LDLSRNPLAELPAAIGQAKNLRALFLRGCKLAALPASRSACKNLQSLWLEECAELDVDVALQVIAQLPKLKMLSLPLSRSLTSLAPLSASKLRTLWLRGNGVELGERLPAGLGKLPQLKHPQVC
jgi:Leucine-rich repeat (LRR) protein